MPAHALRNVRPASGSFQRRNLCNAVKTKIAVTKNQKALKFLAWVLLSYFMYLNYCNKHLKRKN